MLHDRACVLAAYDDGVDGICGAAASVNDWTLPTPCEEWRAIDLAGHLLAVIRYYHELLTAAYVGRAFSLLPVGEALAAKNRQDLAGLPEAAGPERIAEFQLSAVAYRHRLSDVDWSLTLGTWVGLGALTVQEHTGLVLGEWHLHAWDLACAAGVEHRPADPDVVAAGRVALLQPAPQGESWIATLESAGRGPG